MKIAIIGAMEQEIEPFLKKLIGISVWKQKVSYKIYTGQLFGIESVIVKSGIGKVSAALSTTLLLDRLKPEMVINIGSAGGILESLNICDLVISNEVRYHDVNATMFGYRIGQVPKYPSSFYSNPELLSLAKNTANCLSIKAEFGLVVSGDTFINNTKSLSKIRKDFPLAIEVEMEAAAIAQICYAFSVPFLAIKIISDLADNKSHFDFKQNITISSLCYTKLIEKMMLSLLKKIN